MTHRLPSLYPALALASLLAACGGASPEGAFFAPNEPTFGDILCRQNNGGCDPHATCSAGGAGIAQATCACKTVEGYEGDGFTCTDVLGKLNGLRWELPCGGPSPVGGCFTTAAAVSMILGGSSDHVYSIALRFRGFIERRTYTGGTSEGEFFQIGGDLPSPADTFNIYKLEVSDPPGVYYVNKGASGGPGVAVDYIAHVNIRGGATVTLSTDASDGIEADNKNHVVIAGIPPAPNWYDGEFLQMDVVR